MSRLRSLALVAVVGAIAVALAVLTVVGSASPRVARGYRLDVVATALHRPVQLALDPASRLVVLSHGRHGDTAAEILWLDVAGPLPVDASIAPRVVIPFPDEHRKVVFGSLDVDRRTGDVYLGEENGNRVYRLTQDQRLGVVAIGVQHLVGGSGIAIDRRGRLVVLDFSSPDTQLRSETRLPPGLDAQPGEGYQGPLVFRVDLREASTLPRRLDLVPPLFPRAWMRPAGEPLVRFISVAVGSEDDVVLLDSLGQVFRLTAGDLRHVVRLPAGHYHRTNLAVGPDGSVWISTGFHIRQLVRIAPAGTITVVATELGDPAGVLVDAAGRVYLVETALHRIIRLTE
jgi:hypothetical protein